MMAKLYISEYETLPTVTGQGAQIAPEPREASQVVAVSAVSARSTQLRGATRFVRLHTDIAISFRFGGSTVVAVVDDARMPTDATEYFAVNGGAYVAAITN